MTTPTPPYIAAIAAIAHHLPARRVTNGDLAAEYPEWQPEKLQSKTGIAARRIAATDETAADLAIEAARKVLKVSGRAPADIDYVIFCSQSPDYLLPSTACLIQAALGLPLTTGALDMNLGCSGFVYGLGLCKGLIESGQARRVLLLTSDTYSKHINPADRSARAIFGDGAAATIVERVSAVERNEIGPFLYGTDGRGAGDLVVPSSGMRSRAATAAKPVLRGGAFGAEWLHMDGPKIFTFTLSVVPRMANELLAAAGVTMDDVSLIVPHQANAYMLESLRKRMNVPSQKFFIDMREIGNTVSATIPIGLVMAANAGLLKAGQLVMLLGFGIGLSWAGAIIRWRDVSVSSFDATDDGETNVATTV